MDTSQLDLAVHWTARLSAVLFAIALASPAWSTRVSRGSRDLYTAFILAHTAHFFFVAWLANATAGQNMFPGGRSVDDVGGWPTVLAIFAFFYALAFVGLVARRAGPNAGHGLRVANRVTTICLAILFVITYVGLIPQSPWYAVPAGLITAGLVIDAFGGIIRRSRCLNCSSEGGRA